MVTTSSTLLLLINNKNNKFYFINLRAFETSKHADFSLK